MATYKPSVRGAKRGAAGGPKKYTGTWQDMAGLPKPTSGGGGPGKPMPPAKGGGMRGVVPAAYKAAHQAEWDAANHKERMAMRKAAPHERAATSVTRKRKTKKGPASIKAPKAGGKL